MAVNFKTPPLFSDKKPYNRWVEEVKAWTELTPITPGKQGLAIACTDYFYGQSVQKRCLISSL